MYDKLTEIIARKFQVPSDEIEPAASLADLGMDSLDLVEFSLAIETELGVRVSDDELAEAGVVEAVVDLLARRAAAA